MKINNDVSTIVKPTEPKTVKTDVKQENAKIVNQNSDIVEISAEGKQKALIMYIPTSNNFRRS